MEMTKFEGANGKQLALYVWDKVENPRLIVQLVHGMCEHGKRYDDFAKFLNDNGIIVALNDQRGHGMSTDKEHYGYEEGDMWENNVADQIALSKMLSEKYKLPLVLFGHSYGSFLTQREIEINPVPVAFVLSGSCYMNNALTFFGAIIANARAKKAPNEPGTLMANMSFNAYEKVIPGKNAWLNRDEKEVEKYNQDEACGYVASNNFYATFMKGLKTIYAKDSISTIDVNRPIYLFSGAMDPVGEYSKGVVKLYEFYKKVGVKDLTMKLYQGGRHEMLNELNKVEVYNDVLKYLSKFAK